jgi:hypothetical protein
MSHQCTDLIDYNDIPLYYSPSIRAFFILTCPKEHEHKGDIRRPAYFIQFCPWCGSKFPKDLADEKADILQKEHTHNDAHCAHDDGCFPQEFNTDEWWKKRGL